MNPPQIVVLDGHTLNPGDLDWSPLERCGSLRVYDRTSPSQVLERAASADILLTNKTPLTAAMIAELPQLRYIGVLATGYNVVDVTAAKLRGIPVTNVPGYSTASVAQHVWALILELANQVAAHATAVRAGAWAACPDFSFTLNPLPELAGKTLGIIGYGEIGQAVAKIGAAFGMEIITSTRTPRPGVRCVSVSELAAQSDIISLHCPLTESTSGMVNQDFLRQMKSSALLINTGRGPLIVEYDLAEALNAGTIAGAGLDVLSTEPPDAENPLLTAKNCRITPHLAWASVAARTRLLNQVATNLQAFLSGSPIHVVNR
jgi:glycerate dehydrogenase